MTSSTNEHQSGARRLRSRASCTSAALALFAAGMLLVLVTGAAAAVTAVPLGTASSFAVLAGAGARLTWLVDRVAAAGLRQT